MSFAYRSSPHLLPTPIPGPGKVVRCRTRTWLVESVDPSPYWLDLDDDDELADTLASAPEDIREPIESADYFFPNSAAASRFQSHIEQGGKKKLPYHYRWPDEIRDDILALDAQRAELKRLTGLAL